MTSTRLTNSDRLVLEMICASPDGVLFGAKKLQKLLFIAHHPKQFDLKSPRPMRAFRFKVYKHGPFSDEVYDSISRLEDHGLIAIDSKDLRRVDSDPVSPESSDEDAAPLEVRIYRALPDAGAEVVGADEGDLRLVRLAIKKWGWLTSDQIEELVLIRTGLTPWLKARYAGTEWSAFEKQAAEELPKERPEPPTSFWRAQQQFFKERAKLLHDLGAGKFAAYLEEERVALGDDEIDLYKEVLANRGRPPDYIGYVSESGRIQTQAWRTE